MKDDIREKALEQTKEELRTEANREMFMAKAVDNFDSINNDLAKEMERFRDWYSLHFPELTDEISDDEQLVQLLSRGINREDLDSFSSLSDDSTGSPLTDKDEEMLKKILEQIEGKIQLKKELESYIEEIAEEKTSNLEKLLGPLLTARLVSLAGGLEELAKKPASTIQMLGAEKALFRHLKGGGDPPKHGVLFEHQYVNTLPSDKRGKMARFLANKAAMAARMDQYGEKQRGEELREECRQKFEELKD